MLSQKARMNKREQISAQSAIQVDPFVPQPLPTDVLPLLKNDLTEADIHACNG